MSIRSVNASVDVRRVVEAVCVVGCVAFDIVCGWDAVSMGETSGVMSSDGVTLPSLICGTASFGSGYKKGRS